MFLNAYLASHVYYYAVTEHVAVCVNYDLFDFSRRLLTNSGQTQPPGTGEQRVERSVCVD